MNVKTMFAGWKSLEIGSKFQPFIGFGDFHRPDGLAYPLRSDEIHFNVLAGCLRTCTNNQRNHCQSKTLHKTSTGYFLHLKSIPAAQISPESQVQACSGYVVAQRRLADAEPLLTRHIQLLSHKRSAD